MLNLTTAAQLKKVAEARGATLEELAEQAVRQFLRDETGRALQQESTAFRAMHAALTLKYAGDYVAIYDGQVIDHDADQLALVLRIEERYRDAPVLIKQVTTEIDEVYHVHYLHVTTSVDNVSAQMRGIFDEGHRRYLVAECR